MRASRGTALLSVLVAAGALAALAGTPSALASAAAATAAARTSYYVATDGDDGGPGTTAVPFRTVQRGLRAVGPGDVLFIRGGTYDSGVICRSPCPNLSTGTAAAPILVRNQPGEVATIRADVELHDLRYVTIQGLRFAKNPRAFNPDSSLINVFHGDHWVFRDNEVFGAQHYSLLALNGAVTNYHVKNNCLHDIAMVPAHGLGHDHGMYLTGFPDVVARGIVERNVVFNTPGGAGIKVGHLLEERPGVPCRHNPNTLTVRHNSTYNDIINLRLVHGSSNVTVDQNVFVRATWRDPQGGSQNMELYCTWGTGNRLTRNWAWDADAPLDSWYGCRPAKSWTKAHLAGNVDRNPLLVSPGTCAGYANGTAAAAGVGRRALVEVALAGRTDGGPRDLPGTVEGNAVTLRSSLGDPATTDVRYRNVRFGSSGDRWVLGDWDGDGDDTLAAYRSATRTWFLKNANAEGAHDLSFRWGLAGAQAFAGDVNGDGRTDLGLASGGRVYLKYAPFSGPGHDLSYALGAADATYVAGDFDGDGRAGVGYVRGTTWRLRNCPSATGGCGSAGPPTIPAFRYGSAGSRWLVGDWDGDGTDTPGAVGAQNRWSLRNASSAGPAAVSFVFDT